MSLPSKTILFLSTLGENRTEVSSELVNFLRFVKADLNESQEDFDDDFVSCLQESIRRIKSSRKMEERFMVLEEMLKEEREEGKAEGKAEGIWLQRLCLIRKQLSKWQSLEEIADLLDMDLQKVQEICSLILKNPNAGDGELYELYQS